MGSSRLPGKVLVPVAGRSLLAHLIQRLRAATTLDAIAVATTDQRGDDVLVDACNSLGVQVFRGSETDVLARFHGAARAFGARTVVRVTADCPLLDPAEVDRVVHTFLATPGLDYASNQLPDHRRVPLGLAVEVMTREALERAHAEATSPHQREHVTPYLYDLPGRFRTQLLDFPRDLSHLRITVDTPEDLAVVAPVLEHLEGRPDAFTLDAAVAFLHANPDIAQRNRSIVQKDFRDVAGTVLLLRADATLEGGTGHVTRLLGLGEAWQKRGGRAVLATVKLPESLRKRYVDRGLGVVDLPEHVTPGSTQDSQHTQRVAVEQGAKVVLADGYAFGHEMLQTLRTSCKVAYVDDFCDADLPVDLVLMPNAGAVAPERPLAPVVLAGAEFTPVRREFRDVPRLDRTFAQRPLRLLLTFGGTDPARASLPFLQAAVAVAHRVPLHVTLLLGPAHPDVAAVRDAAGPDVTILHDVQDMAGLLQTIDLAVTAGGTTCWELATLGVPMALVQVADNQAVVLFSLLRAGASVLLPGPDRWTEALLIESLHAFVTLPPERLIQMSRAGQALIDGRGADRIADALARLALDAVPTGSFAVETP